MTTYTAPATIQFFDENSKLLGARNGSRARRFSVAAAADHRTMDAFFKANPSTKTAKLIIGRSVVNFVFVNGRSETTMFNR